MDGTITDFFDSSTALDMELIDLFQRKIPGSYFHNNKLHFVKDGFYHELPLGRIVSGVAFHSDAYEFVIDLNDENFARVYQPNAKLRDLYQEK